MYATGINNSSAHRVRGRHLHGANHATRGGRGDGSGVAGGAGIGAL